MNSTKKIANKFWSLIRRVSFLTCCRTMLPEHQYLLPHQVSTSLAAR
jgi:hypothetical protein